MTEPAGPRPAQVRGLAGIVLAGGRSRRFGADKLGTELDGRPLLWHAIAPFGGRVDELVVVIGPNGPEPALPDVTPGPVVVRDPLPAGGPLVGLLAGLRAIASPIALVVGADMPSVRPAILEALVAVLVSSGPDAGLAVLVEGDRLRPLPCAVRSETCRPAAERLVARGERSLRSLMVAAGAVGIAEPAWRRFDPDADSLRDIDTPEDLARFRDERSRRPV